MLVPGLRVGKTERGCCRCTSYAPGPGVRLVMYATASFPKKSLLMSSRLALVKAQVCGRVQRSRAYEDYVRGR